MAYERPGWAQGNEMPPPPGREMRMINIDVQEFVRTRDALSAAYLGLSTALDLAVKAYLNHTQTVLHADQSLNIGLLMQPFNAITNHAQMAQMALQQNGVAPGLTVANGEAINIDEAGDGKKKRKKRAYKARDPNAPKRPLTAYFRFLGENRTAIAKEIHDNPELFSNAGKPGDISRIATDRWNALTKPQQEPYRQAYQGALKEYEKEVERYKASGGNAQDLNLVDESALGLPSSAGAAQTAEADDNDSDTSSSEESSDDEEVVPAVAAPPAPSVKSPKKAAPKKSQPTTVAPAQVFSAPNPVPTPVAAPSSPTRKRAAVAESEGAAKKRSRKSGADKTVVAASDPIPTPAAAPAPVASPEVEAAVKPKKEKKKRKSEA